MCLKLLPLLAFKDHLCIFLFYQKPGHPVLSLLYDLEAKSYAHHKHLTFLILRVGSETSSCLKPFMCTTLKFGTYFASQLGFILKVYYHN